MASTSWVTCPSIQAATSFNFPSTATPCGTFVGRHRPRCSFLSSGFWIASSQRSRTRPSMGIASVPTGNWSPLELATLLDHSSQALCLHMGLSLGLYLDILTLFIWANDDPSSRVNGDVGARTQMASLVTSAVVLLAIFFLLPWLYYLPKCVLASV